NRGLELRRLAENPQIVVENVVVDPKPASNAGVAALPRRISEANTRQESRGLRLRLSEGDQPGHAGDRVDDLVAFRVRHRLILVTQAEIDGEVGTNLPAVVSEEPEKELVPGISAAAQGSLSDTVRIVIVHVIGQITPFVIAARALQEHLRGNRFPSVKPKLEAVRAPRPAHIVGQSIRVLNPVLRRVRI